MKRLRQSAMLAASLLWPVAVGLSSPLRAESATPSAALESGAASTEESAATGSKLKAASPGDRSEAIKLLFEQANYWWTHFQPSRAIESLNRILTLGDNADALVMLAQIQSGEGQDKAALAALDRLRKKHGDDPRIAQIERDIKIGAPDAAQLAAARAFVQDGRMMQAVAAYKKAFRGETPPDRFASEYYLTLGATAAGYDPAREALARLSEEPSNLRAQLAYADLLTHRENTLDEGLARLGKLAQNEGTAEDADKSLRQALLWLPDQPSSRAPVEAYLGRHPGDEEIKQKLASIMNPPAAPVDEAARARVDGFENMKGEHYDEAERRFQAALAINASDADAIAGLGYLRLRQKRSEEGRKLLRQALDLGTTDADNVKVVLNNTDENNNIADPAAARKIQAQFARVAQLTEARRYDEAERLLRRLAGTPLQWGHYLQIGDIQSRAGKLREAEVNFRRVIAMQPDNNAAKIGLAGVMLRQHRDAEAEAIYNQLGDTHAIGQIRAERLRSEAARITDPVAQAGLYRAASKSDPSNPWLRLELARALLRQGRQAEARQAMLDVGETGAEEQSVLAAYYFAVEINDLTRAAELVALIPESKRTSAMVAMQRRVAVQAEIAALKQAVSGSQLRDRLIALAGRPDPTGVRVEEVGKALVALNDKAAVVDAVKAATAASSSLTPEQRLAYAGALLGAGREQDAERFVTGVQSGRLTHDQRVAMDAMISAVVSVEADRLRQDGHYPEAQQRLVQRLSSDPKNPLLIIALARVYRARGELGRAVSITQDLLERNPTNLDVRRADVDMLIAMGDLDRAADVAADGVLTNRGDVRAQLMAAEVAKQQGEFGFGLQRLDAARRIADKTESNDATASIHQAESLEFRATFPAFPADGSYDQITPQVRAGVGVFDRTGVNGEGRVTVLTAPVEASFSPTGVGMLRVQATPTSVNSGAPSATDGALSSFGTNPLRPSAPIGVPSQSAEGVGLNVSYNWRYVTADIGTTPIGFYHTNIVGGVELAPTVANDLRLRVTVDRRAVINSALSYSGARDPGTGQTWGEAMRNRGYAQLEWAPNRWFVYGGAGGGVVTGDNIRNNTFVEAQVGASYGIYVNGAQELRAGVVLPYYGYAQNQDFFSFGQGGYFSPQNSVAAELPISWRDTPTDYLTYKVQGMIGYQSFQQSATPVFANNSTLQAALVSAAATNPYITTIYSGSHTAGLTYSASGEFEYKISNLWRVGGRAAYLQAGQYQETNAIVYCRYLFEKGKL